MRGKCRFRKSIALVVSAALVLGLAPIVPGNIYNRAMAGSEDTTGNEDTGDEVDDSANRPSVQVYADVDTLTGKTFDPGTVGTAEAVAKLKFGKKTVDGVKTPIEWYILGPDKGIEGNNIAIFVTDNIGKEAFFDWESVITTAEADVHTYTGDEDEEYVKGKRTPDSDMVAYSHYGESNIRKALRKMADASDTTYDYFSRAEKDLMQKTKVLTHEWDNEDMLYTTKDKLYLASVQRDGSSRGNVIYVGSTGIKSISDEYTSKTLQWDPYWKGASESDFLEVPKDSFWTRSPETCEGVTPIVVATALNGGRPLDPIELYSCGVRPASNLKLTNVLFASAAEPASNTDYNAAEIDLDTAMTLRFSGSSSEVGTVTVDCNIIDVSKGSSTEPVYLVIQGKNTQTDADWYWSALISDNTKTISGVEGWTVPATVAEGFGTSWNLSDCKIWLETEGSDGLIYAVKATTAPHTHTWRNIESEEYFVEGSTTYTDHDDEYHTISKKYYKSCVCGAKSDETFDGLTEELDLHDEYEWGGDETYHWKKCKYCGHKDASTEDTHSVDPETKKCECGYDLNTGHNIQFVESKAPTCTSVGYESYYACKLEGHSDIYNVNGIGALIRIDKRTELHATGHSKTCPYKYDAFKHWKICENVNANDGTVCGAKFDETDHTFDGNKCTTCGYIKSSGYRGTTYSDGSTRNSDRYSSVSSGASQNSFSSSSSSGLTASSNSASGWSQDASGRWWYYDGNTKIVGWVYDKSDGSWYYVDAEKGRVYGWFYDTEDGYWYYLDANTGAMLTGWQLIGGKQYYFAPAPAAATYTFDTSSAKWVYSNAANYRPYGSMYADTTTPDNHSVDADGAKIQ